MLTSNRLHEVLKYSPKTGIFVWKIRVSQNVKAGDMANCCSDGYIHIRIDKKLYKAHRLAFLYMEGYFPEYQVDHMNGIRSDNRWKNLRHVSRSCNFQNCKLQANSTSGFTGVSWYKKGKKWHAQICIHKKVIHIGYYDTVEEAALARCRFEDESPDWTCNHLAINRVKLKAMGYKI